MYQYPNHVHHYSWGDLGRSRVERHPPDPLDRYDDNWLYGINPRYPGYNPRYPSTSRYTPGANAVPERVSAPGVASRKPLSIPVGGTSKKNGDPEGGSMVGLRDRPIRVRRKPKLPSYVVSNNVEWSESVTDANTLWVGYKSFDRFEILRLVSECLVRKILAPYKLDIPTRDTPLTTVAQLTAVTDIEKGSLAGYTLHYIKTSHLTADGEPGVTTQRIELETNAINTFNSMVDTLATNMVTYVVNHNILHRIDVHEVDYDGAGIQVRKTVRTIENIDKYRMDLKVLANFRVQNVTRGGTHIAGEDEDTNSTDNLHASPISGKVYTFSDLTPRFNGQFQMEKTKNNTVNYAPSMLTYQQPDTNATRRRDYKLDMSGIRTNVNASTQFDTTYQTALTEWRRPLSYPTQVFRNCSGIDSVAFKPGTWRTAKMNFTFNGTMKQLMTGMYFGKAVSVNLGPLYAVQPSTGKCMVFALTNTIRNRTNELVSINVNSRYNYMCSMIPPKRRDPPQQRLLLEHSKDATGLSGSDYRALGAVIA